MTADLARGQGRLRVAISERASAVVCAATRDPLRLLVPRPRGLAAWCYQTGFGGGLVSGDHLDLTVEVDRDARLLLATQAATRVYRAGDDRAGSAQSLSCLVASGAMAAIVSDPVVCHAGSRYRQHTRLTIAGDSDLLLIEGLHAGRTARGESWAMDRCQTRLELRVDDRPLLDERLDLSRSVVSRSSFPGTDRWTVVALAILWGPWHRLLRHVLVDACEHSTEPVRVTASSLADGLLLRLAASEPDQARAWWHRHLGAVAGWLGDNPWARRPG